MHGVASTDPARCSWHLQTSGLPPPFPLPWGKVASLGRFEQGQYQRRTRGTVTDVIPRRACGQPPWRVQRVGGPRRNLARGVRENIGRKRLRHRTPRLPVPSLTHARDWDDCAPHRTSGARCRACSNVGPGQRTVTAPALAASRRHVSCSRWARPRPDSRVGHGQRRAPSTCGRNVIPSG